MTELPSATSDIKTDISAMTGQKRAAPTIDSAPNITESGSNRHATKRFRGGNRSTTDIIISPCGTRRPPTSRRYGRKGRTSSPPCSAADEIDFDALPAAFADHSGESKSKPEARNSATKGNARKDATTEKLFSKKYKAEQDMTTLPQTLRRAVIIDTASIGAKRPLDLSSNKVGVIRPCNLVHSN